MTRPFNLLWHWQFKDRIHRIWITRSIGWLTFVFDSYYLAFWTKPHFSITCGQTTKPDCIQLWPLT